MIEYLGSWSVRWLVVPSGSENARLLTGYEEVSFVANDSRMTVFENLMCTPMATVRPSESPQRAVPIDVSMSGNSIQLKLDQMSGLVTVNCVYHPAYELIADGKPVEDLQESDDHRLQFRATDGMQRVTIRFSDTRFMNGVALATLTCVLIALLLILKDARRLVRRRRDLSPAPVLTPAESPPIP
jgi:hypothetical protein